MLLGCFVPISEARTINIIINILAIHHKGIAANEKLCELNAELEQSNSKIDAIKDDYRRIIEWSQIFDASDMAVKKMIAGYIIKQVSVYSGYRLHLVFSINFAQFELGLDIPNEYDAQQNTA